MNVSADEYDGAGCGVLIFFIYFFRLNTTPNSLERAVVKVDVWRT